MTMMTIMMIAIRMIITCTHVCSAHVSRFWGVSGTLISLPSLLLWRGPLGVLVGKSSIGGVLDYLHPLNYPASEMALRWRSLVGIFSCR